MKTAFYIIVILAIAILGAVFAIGFWINPELDYEKFYSMVIESPDKASQVSVLIHVTDAQHDAFTETYIIPGICERNTLPKGSNFIAFPDSTGIAWEWITNHKIRLYCSRKPSIANFYSEAVTIELEIGREKINQLEKDGKLVVWDKIE